MIHQTAQKLYVLWGWRRLVAAFTFGALAAASMQPLLLWPVLFVSFPVLIWLIDGVFLEPLPRSRVLLTSFALGWAFGFGYFLASLYWVGAAFLVDAETYAWMMPFAVAVLPAGMALYWAAATAVAALLWLPGIRRIFLFAALLALSEWLRGRLFTGFPWNALGYAAEAFDGLSQLAAYVGVWGLTFLVILWSCLPALWADVERRGSGRLWAQGILIAIVPLWALGMLRLENAPSPTVPGVTVRIVQPNIPQNDKWRIDNAETILDQLLALSIEPAGNDHPTHIVWPESSVPFLIDESKEALDEIARTFPDSTVLLMGSLRRSATGSGRPGLPLVYNSLFAIEGTGRPLAVYDKSHLVPYGEYLPLAKWLERLGFRRLVPVPGSFDAGPGINTYAISRTPPFSPLICYEAIFPRQVILHHRRPEWLLNITNDGWFGLTSGPYQHLAQSRFRSIEEGLPLIRAANTGISAVVDAHGRILKHLPLGVSGVIEANLPGAVSPPPYSRWGDLIFFVLLTLSAGTILLPQRFPQATVTG
jgi:apolipoprotein N-acyltransferase